MTTITDLTAAIADALTAMGVDTDDREALTEAVQRHRIAGYEEHTEGSEALDTLLRAVWDDVTDAADWPEGEVEAEAEGCRARLNGSRVDVWGRDGRWAGEGRWDGTIYDGGGNLDADPDVSAEIMEALANALRAKLGLMWGEGDRVEGGEIAEDYDTGEVDSVDGDAVTVRWDSGVTTTQPASLLRREGARPVRG